MKIKKNLISKDPNASDIQKTSQNNSFCKFHNQQCDLVCLNDGKHICYNCVLFGQHKGHQVQTCQKFYQKNLQYQESLLTIASNIKFTKQQTAKKIKLCQYLKKQQFIKVSKIKEVFQSLIVELKVKQKQCIRKIEKHYSYIQGQMSKIDQKLRISLQKNQLHKNWFSQFDKLVHKQSVNNIWPDLQINQKLLTEQSRTDYLQIGKKIQSEYIRSFQNLQQQIKILAKSIQIKLQYPSYKSIFIENWCKIQCKQLKNQEQKSEYQQQDSQFYLLSSVQSFQDFEQCKANNNIYQKQIQEQELLLNSIKTDENHKDFELESETTIKNVNTVVLQQVNEANRINIKVPKAQNQKCSTNNMRTNKIQELKRKIMQKKLIR